MLRRVATVACLAALGIVFLLSPGAASVWPSSELYAYGSTETLTVTPSYSIDGDYYIYQYVLTNNTAHTDIESFELTLAPTLDMNEITIVSGPDDWWAQVRPLFHQIDWSNDSGDPIAPGGSATFKIRTKYGPSAGPAVVAACHDGLGWSGDTYGPVPEPSSIIALMCGVMGLAGFRRKR